LICTFRTKVHSSLGDRTFLFPEGLRGPMVFILEYYSLYRWMWYLQAFGNCSQGWTSLVEVHIFFWGLGWFLLIFPWCQAKRQWVWRLALKYIHRYTSNLLKGCQLAYQNLLKPWRHFAV
jgi:hypothetical protein